MLSVIAGVSLCGFFLFSVGIMSVGRTRSEQEMLDPVLIRSAPAERNVYSLLNLNAGSSVGAKYSSRPNNEIPADISLLRSSRNDLRAGFHKHSVPTELVKPNPEASLDAFVQGPELDYSTFNHT